MHRPTLLLSNLLNTVLAHFLWAVRLKRQRGKISVYGILVKGYMQWAHISVGHR